MRERVWNYTHASCRCPANIALLLLCLVSLPGLTTFDQTITGTVSMPSQPLAERQAQDSLPQAQDEIWDTLAKVKVTLNENTGVFKAEMTDGARQLDGQTVKISGFIVPLEPVDKFKHFLLSKRTPTCPFCQPGDPNEIVEIYANKNVKWTESLVSYEGKFELSNQTGTGIFFILKDANRK